MSRLAFMFGALSVVAGCGSSSVTSCSGMVKLDNQPIAGVMVFLWPADGSPPMAGKGGTAITDVTGKFLYGTGGSAPAPLTGTYKVTLSRVVDHTGRVVPGGKAEPGSTTETIAPIYLSPETTPIKVQVDNSPKIIEIAISSDAKK